jgi:hypothetical protein
VTPPPREAKEDDVRKKVLKQQFFLIFFSFLKNINEHKGKANRLDQSQSL